MSITLNSAQNFEEEQERRMTYSTHDLFDPLTAYRETYREAHQQNVLAHFETLAAKAGVDETENDQLVTGYRQAADLHKKLKFRRTLWRLAGALALIILAWSVFFGVRYTQAHSTLSLSDHLSLGYEHILTIFGVLLVIGLSVFSIYKIFKMLSALSRQIKDSDLAEKNALGDCYTQMNPLNLSYEWDTALRLVEQTLPLFKIDPYFNEQRFAALSTAGLPDFDEDATVVYTLSGAFGGNPFVLARSMEMEMGEKTWSGSKTIHWTETRNWTEMQQNANGQTVPVHRSETISHSQTLTASISRPCPYYHNNTQLWYANEAAPNLSFSRAASNIDEKGAFSAWRLKRANKKALDKKQKQSLAQGGNFMLTDSEFETLFNAHDRDHEVEFRLLFTPLARKQMLSLMKENTEGYGDDFAFVKTGKMNAIFPRHLQKFEFIEAPLQFSHFNFKAARQRFIDYHHDFFRHLYFAFAPLMTIPIYQQTPPPATAGYGAERVSPWASEVMAHHLGAARFIPPEAATPVVLKANRDQVGNEIAMTGHAFLTEGRVHTVNMRGNDGGNHDVHIHWTEYIPVERTQNMKIDCKPNLRYRDVAVSGDALLRVGFRHALVASLCQAEG